MASRPLQAARLVARPAQTVDQAVSLVFKFSGIPAHRIYPCNRAARTFMNRTPLACKFS